MCSGLDALPNPAYIALSPARREISGPTRDPSQDIADVGLTYAPSSSSSSASRKCQRLASATGFRSRTNPGGSGGKPHPVASRIGSHAVFGPFASVFGKYTFPPRGRCPLSTTGRKGYTPSDLSRQGGFLASPTRSCSGATELLRRRPVHDLDAGQHRTRRDTRQDVVGDRRLEHPAADRHRHDKRVNAGRSAGRVRDCV